MKRKIKNLTRKFIYPVYNFTPIPTVILLIIIFFVRKTLKIKNKVPVYVLPRTLIKDTKFVYGKCRLKLLSGRSHRSYIIVYAGKTRLKEKFWFFYLINTFTHEFLHYKYGKAIMIDKSSLKNLHILRSIASQDNMDKYTSLEEKIVTKVSHRITLNLLYRSSIFWIIAKDIVQQVVLQKIKKCKP